MMVVFTTTPVAFIGYLMLRSGHPIKWMSNDTFSSGIFTLVFLSSFAAAFSFVKLLLETTT